MKVLALTRYGRLGASSRMRLYQYTSSLAAFGIQLETSSLVDDEYLSRLYATHTVNWLKIIRNCAARSAKLLQAKRFDLLWIEKELFPNLPAWSEEILSALGIRYIVDYDDAVFHNYDLSKNPVKRLLRHKIDHVMRNAALVVCGNRYLAERALSQGVQRVEIVPTAIDLQRYKVVDQQQRNEIVVGWMGSPTTAKYLEIAAPALERISTKYDVILRVVGAQFSSNRIRVDSRPWAEESEVNEIQDFDVGIMPLVDGPWERGKCGYKLIQYMGCGKPVIASPVGVNSEIVRPGVNGYLANDTQDWLSALEMLCQNAKLRSNLGMQGRNDVENSYCIQVTAPHVAQLFQQTGAREIVERAGRNSISRT